jgi:hypothetical protein
MVMAVKIPVHGGVLEPEIRAQVNHPATFGQQGGGIFRSDAVRQRQKNDFSFFREQGRIGFGEPDSFGGRLMGEFRKRLCNGLAGKLARGDCGEFGMRMGEQQAHEFLAGITGGADDADLHFFGHLSFHKKHTNCGKREWKSSASPLFVHQNKRPRKLNLRGRGKRTGSTFAILEAFAGAGLAVFFAFPFAGIAGQQALGLEGGAQIDIALGQGAGDAVPDSAGLAVGAAALDVDADVNLAGERGDDQRLVHNHPQRLGGEIILEGPAVDEELAGARGDAHAGDGGLAAAGAEDFRGFSHKSIAITF